MPQRTAGIAVAVALAELTLFNFYQVVNWVPRSLGQNDFRLFYAAATIGLQQGWDRIYDADRQRAAVQAAWPMGSGTYWVPFLNPPPMAWLVVPLTLLPAPVAYLLWVLLLASCLVAASQLAAPPGKLNRLVFGGLGLGFLPSFVAVAYGQTALLIGFALVVAWALLRRDRQVAAGLVLAMIVIKPQVALLVPLALLASGRRRAFAAWCVLAGSLTLLALASLGTRGVEQYLALARPLFQDAYYQRWSLTSLVGQGWAWYAAILLVGAGTLLAAWRCRENPGHVVAIGVCGSLLVNHYLTPADFTILLVPIWLVARGKGPGWLLGLLGLGWVTGWFSLVFGPPVMAFEVVLPAALALFLVDRTPVTENRSWSASRSGGRRTDGSPNLGTDA